MHPLLLLVQVCYRVIFYSKVKTNHLAELLAAGSTDYDNNKETEIYSFETNQWRQLQPFPYGSGPYLYGISAVYLKGYFYTFGGNSGNYLLDNIARLDPIQGTFLFEV